MKRVAFRPSKLHLWMWIALCVASIVVPALVMLFAFPIVSWLVPTAIAVFVVICIVDLVALKQAPEIVMHRQLPVSLSVRVPQTITMVIENLSAKALYLQCADMLPNTWQLNSRLPDIELSPGDSCSVRYNATPGKRGLTTINGMQVRVISGFSLWQVTWHYAHNTEHRVYPEFTAISDLAGLQGTVNLRQAGLKKMNKRGSGLDFMQLRDYREGDSMRQVNWRATSRFNKLISTEYQEEKNQHIIIMLDAGRRMRVQDDDLSYFDHALNAIIMLAHTALKNGDSVSLQSFGAQSRWLSQVKGTQNMSQVLNHFYDLYPEKIASDYVAAAQDLMNKQPKRALVLLVSCLRDEDFTDLLNAANLLSGKHLVAVISIAEPIYQDIQKSEIVDFDAALAYTAAAKIQSSIAANQKRLKHAGIMCINANAAQLTPSVLNTYLSVKKSGLL